MTSALQQKKISLSAGLGWSFKIYSQNFIPLLTLALMGSILSLIYQIIKTAHVEMNLIIELFLFVGSYVISVVFYLALVRAIADIEEGIKRPFARLLGDGLRKLFPNLGIIISLAILVTIPFAVVTYCDKIFINPSVMLGIIFIALKLLLFILSVYALMILIFCPYALILDDANIWDAFKSGMRIANKHFWPIFLVLLLILIGVILIFLPMSIVLTLFKMHPAIIAAAIGVISFIGMPLVTAYFFRLFTLFNDKEPSVKTC